MAGDVAQGQSTNVWNLGVVHSTTEKEEIKKSRKYKKERKRNERKRKFKGKGTRQGFSEYGGTHL